MVPQAKPTTCHTGFTVIPTKGGPGGSGKERRMEREYRDPVERAQAELDEILARRNTELGIEPVVEGETVVAPAAPEPTPAEPAPEPVAAQPPAAPEPVRATELSSEDKAAAYDSLKPRFDTLQGKYNKEVPRLINANRHSTEEIARLRILVTELETAAQRAPESPTPPEVKAVDSDAFKRIESEYGKEHADSVLALIEMKTPPPPEPVKVAPEPPVVPDNAQQVEAAFHNDLAILAGDDWPAVNDDPAFGDWSFATIDEREGRTYNELMNEAYRAKDARGVAFFFNRYRDEQAAAVAPIPEPQPDNAQPTAEQEAMLAPPRHPTQNALITDAGSLDRVFTRTEVDKFYSDAAKGRYSKKPKELKELEAEILDALANGRVVMR